METEQDSCRRMGLTVGSEFATMLYRNRQRRAQEPEPEPEAVEAAPCAQPPRVDPHAPPPRCGKFAYPANMASRVEKEVDAQHWAGSKGVKFGLDDLRAVVQADFTWRELSDGFDEAQRDRAKHISAHRVTLAFVRSIVERWRREKKHRLDTSVRLGYGKQLDALGERCGIEWPAMPDQIKAMHESEVSLAALERLFDEGVKTWADAMGRLGLRGTTRRRADAPRPPKPTGSMEMLRQVMERVT